MQHLRTLAFSLLVAAPSAQDSYYLPNTPLPPGVKVGTALALGDLQGDGDLDALVVEQGRTRFFVNHPAGRFLALELPHPGGTASLFSGAALADLDGDGDLDVYLANEGGSPGPGLLFDHVFAQQADGSFTGGGSVLPAHLQPSKGVELADMDGDGDSDVVLATTGADRLYRNEGGLVFSNAGSADLESALFTGSLVLADYDGDGDLDVARRVAADPAAEVLLNDGSGGLSLLPGALPVGPTFPGPMAGGDLDGDGDADLLSVGGIGGNLLLVNGGAGLFSDASAFLPAPAPSQLEPTGPVALADADGDGDLDAFLGTELTEPTRLWLNTPAGFAEAPPGSMPATASVAHALAAADLDGDLDVDLLQLGSRAHRLNLGDGAGTFAEVHPPLGGMIEHSFDLDVLSADFNGDGIGDLFLREESVFQPAPDVLYLGTGTGALLPAPLPPYADETGAAAAGDVDGDGDVDLYLGLTTFYSAGLDVLLSNDGSGAFADASGNLPGLAGDARGASLADLDGDGDLDALVLHGTQEADRVLRNAGSGSFTHDPGDTPATPTLSNTHAVGDLDGDGDLDAFLGIGGSDRLYVNDGTGRLTSAPTGASPPDYLTTDVELGDLDGDGDLDALVTPSINGVVTAVQLLRNNGLASFKVPSGALPAVEANAAALLDHDGDGDLDAYLARHADDVLLENNGGGLFAEVQGSLHPLEDELNTDVLVAPHLPGEREWLFLWSRHLQALRPRERALSWDTAPGIGKPLLFELHDEPAAAWVLAYAASEASLPLPPLGTLMLDPATLTVAASGAITGTGQGSALFDVPASASLVGVAVPWQAAFGASFQLGTLERTVFSGL